MTNEQLGAQDLEINQVLSKEVSTKQQKSGWPKGKPRSSNKHKDSVEQDINQDIVDPLLARFLYEIKVEELFAYFILNMRAQNKDRESIVNAFSNIKKTLTENNIDIKIAEEKLKVMVAQNRTTLGYDKNDINKMIEMAIKRVTTPQEPI